MKKYKAKDPFTSSTYGKGIASRSADKFVVAGQPHIQALGAGQHDLTTKASHGLSKDKKLTF